MFPVREQTVEKIIRSKKFMFTQKTKSSSPLKLFTIREKPTLDKKRPEASELDSIT